ncbi:TPA: hypothetical protein QCY10_000127 [Bacillus mobilis]|nr:hypothetical protein [Bacillus mobilis]
MPKITTRLKLELPLGNEHVKREVLNKAFEDIDKVVMLQTDLDNANKENTKYVNKKFEEAKTYADETATTKATQALSAADTNATSYASNALESAKKYTDDKLGKPNGIAGLDKDGKVPTTQLPKRTASEITLVDQKGYYTQKNAEAALQQVGDTLKNMQQKLSNYKSSKDTNGIFSIVECKRKDGTIFRKQILSDPDTNGNYRKQTINFYDESGTKIIGTDVYVITYDADGDVISEVLQ